MNQLQPFADDIWCVRAPLSFFSVHVGTQMTIVRLNGGSLLLHSPIPIDAALKREIDALGPVRHIVCPNLFHHLYGGDAKALWPDALLHGPAALHAKRRDLRFDGLFSEQLHPDWQADLAAITIEGSALGETVLGKDRGDPGRDLVAPEAAQRQREVLCRGRHQDLRLRIREDESDEPAELPALTGGVEPVHDDAPRARLDETVQEPREGRLARAVRSDHRDPRCGQLDAHVTEDRRALAVHGHAREGDRGDRGVRPHASPRRPSPAVRRTPAGRRGAERA